MDNIDERVEKAIEYLALTDEPAAKAKALYMGLEAQTKTIEAQAFLGTTGTVAERESIARVSDSYKVHLLKVEDAFLAWEIYRNRRSTAEMMIEYWRSLNANRRQG